MINLIKNNKIMTNTFRSFIVFSKFIRSTSILCICLVLSSCSFDDISNLKSTEGDYNKDYIYGADREEFYKDMTTDVNKVKTLEIVKMPYDISNIELISEPLVSVSITEDMNIRDVFIDLIKTSGFDADVSSRVNGKVNLFMQSRPITDVLERITEAIGAVYKIDKGLISIRPDFEFSKDYSLSFLNLERDTQTVTTVTNGSQNEQGGIAQSTINTTSTLSTQSKTEYWDTIFSTIMNIVYAEDPMMSLVDAKLDEVSSSSFNSRGAGGGKLSDSKITINKQAGLVSVITNHRKHRQVQKFLTELDRKLTTQVLIEAKILEISLKDQYKTGINWQNLAQEVESGFRVDSSFGNKNAFIKEDDNLFTLNYLNPGQFTAAISLLDKFGTVRALSSPRIIGMNNQPSILSFATNTVYYEIDIENDTTTSSNLDNIISKESITSTLNVVPIGIILNILPAINLDNRTISMNINPILSRISGYVNDPGFAFYVESNLPTSQLVSEVPIIEKKELTSIAKVKNGQSIVIGGLLEEKINVDDLGTPYLGQIPWIGNAFKSKIRSKEIIETVIFIKATIIDNPSNVTIDSSDVRLYDKMFNDSRRAF